MRQVVLDTETTGINPKQGHRIIEIGCVELIDRKLSGNHYHVYVNPDTAVGDSVKIHGITNEFLADKPRFHQIATGFYDFIHGAELVIHNAPFDVGFINHEFAMLAKRIEPVERYCQILDTLAMARKKHPGQKNNLDILCKRYGIDNSHRELHGALLDAEILADVYLLMSGGQSALQLGNDAEGEQAATDIRRISRDRPKLRVIRANGDEESAHQQYLRDLVENAGQVIWE